jgi:GT2 family glycosyltransferase
MDISIIIVNYNVRQFLREALGSIRRALPGIQAEIFVVDNASEDGSAEMVKQNFPGVVLIENGENVGFAKANNIALRRATGDYLLLINPDTVVQEDTFSVMLDFFRKHPDAGLAGCKILNPDGSLQLPCRRGFPTPWVAFTKIFGLSTLFPKSRLFGKYNLTYMDPDQTYPVDAVSGSFMMVRREAFDRVGGLDESFFMYGEDLDWCYRIRKAGYRVYYVHGTKIVHFKGQSTRRSDIDELKHFYEAMELFVEKHFSHSGIVRLFLRLGIGLRSTAASLARAGGPLAMASLDFVLVDLALFLSAFIYYGNMTHFTFNAHPAVWLVPALIVVLTTTSFGLYRAYSYWVSRMVLSVVMSYVLISALVFFAREYAYSRLVVLMSGGLSLLFLPGWRFWARIFSRSSAHGSERARLFGSRTLIVGTGRSAQGVVRKLRARVDGGYNVVGFIDTSLSHLGEKISGVEIVGSVDTIGKVIAELRVSEVIFSMDGLSYSEILSVIGRTSTRGVNYRLVPDSLEAIIGRTRIDDLDVLPLVEIEYNIQKPLNRASKRLFDIVSSACFIPLLYIPIRVAQLFGMRPRQGGAASRLLLLPKVLSGDLSLVGLPLDAPRGKGVQRDPAKGQIYLGPPGLTGIVQINSGEGFGAEEIERLELYYAKNQTLGLDLEILVKAIFGRTRH